MTFRAVIFDLGGVVLGSPLHAFRDYESELGLPAGSLGRAVNAAGAEGAWSRLERGELAMDQFFTAFDAEMAAAGAQISAVALMERIALASGVRPQMVAAIRRLRARGLRTAALTNNWVNADQTLKMDTLRDEFDVFVESAREGMRKPDPRIYQLVCDRLGVAPAEAVFLDDIGENLKAARALGMATIKVDDPDQALAELERTLGLPLRPSV
ncbi:MAG TPA: HAD family phosphatase [Polyangiales bacterium]|nr:HAD family phosphatase [Polyangiales bacterium]